MSRIAVTINGEEFEVEVDQNGPLQGTIKVRVNGITREVTLPEHIAPGEQITCLWVNHTPYELAFKPDFHQVRADHQVFDLAVQDRSGKSPRQVCGDGRIQAPIPGVIQRVMVAPGDPVESGQPLLVLEAMKMENEICAPRSGKVGSVKVKSGQVVVLRELLLTID